MLDWRNNLVYIPEIGFGDFASVIRTNSHDLNTSYKQMFKYDKQIYRVNEEILSLTITETDIDKLQDLTEKLLNKGSNLNEIIVFIDNNENVISFTNCLVINIDTRIAEDFISSTMEPGINNYVLEVSIVSEYTQQVTTKMYNRKKKLKKLISKITIE